jgi:hypothetical protein
MQLSSSDYWTILLLALSLAAALTDLLVGAQALAKSNVGKSFLVALIICGAGALGIKLASRALGLDFVQVTLFVLGPTALIYAGVKIRQKFGGAPDEFNG